MCEEFPLSLVEQVIPIIDLMARTSAHFARLRDFIKLEFPPGFPVKIGTVQQTTGAPIGSARFCGRQSVLQGIGASEAKEADSRLNGGGQSYPLV